MPLLASQRRNGRNSGSNESMDLGYDRLELGDPRGAKPGRTGLVGQGHDHASKPPENEPKAMRLGSSKPLGVLRCGVERPQPSSRAGARLHRQPPALAVGPLLCSTWWDRFDGHTFLVRGAAGLGPRPPWWKRRQAPEAAGRNCWPGSLTTTLVAYQSCLPLAAESPLAIPVLAAGWAGTPTSIVLVAAAWPARGLKWVPGQPATFAGGGFCRRTGQPPAPGWPDSAARGEGPAAW